MGTNEQILDLFHYDYWSNQRVLHCLIGQLENVPKECLKLMNHIIYAQGVWYNRFFENDAKVQLWKEMEPNELMHQMNLWYRAWVAKIERMKQHHFEVVFEYHNTQGVAYENTLQEMLFHIINHGTYHRGQLMVHLKAAGCNTITTDYIVYKREK